MINPFFVENGTVELVGVVGSQAYGLATPESDIDLLGVFTAPVKDLLAGVGHDRTVVTPKTCGVEGSFHELTKFVKLAAGGNPTATELLWLPNYTICSPVGQVLLFERETFVSLRYVAACAGYAAQQLQKVVNRTDPLKRSKHARHLMRLTIQAEQFLQTGVITPMLTPEQVTEVRAAETLPVGELQELFERYQEKIRVAEKTSDIRPTSNPDAVRAVLDRCRTIQTGRSC